MEVAHHPAVQALIDRGEHAFLTGSLKLNLDVAVTRDLNPGDTVLVTIVNSAGEPLTNVYAEIKTVGFEPIEIKDVGIVGENRVHGAKPTDEIAASDDASQGAQTA